METAQGSDWIQLSWS